jgi:hypothetical protein
VFLTLRLVLQNLSLLQFRLRFQSLSQRHRRKIVCAKTSYAFCLSQRVVTVGTTQRKRASKSVAGQSRCTKTAVFPTLKLVPRCLSQYQYQNQFHSPRLVYAKVMYAFSHGLKAATATTTAKELVTRSAVV